MLLLLALACTPEFDAARTRLGDFRILSVGLREDALAAPTWSGAGPWHDRAVTKAWVAGGEELDPALPPDPLGTVEVTVTSAGGTSERARLVREADAADIVVEDVTVTAGQEPGVASLSVDAPGSTHVRWSVDGGSLLTTGSHAADWTLPEDGAIATAFLLALDDRGGTAWAWVDLSADPARATIGVGTRRFGVDAVPAVLNASMLATIAEDPDEGYALVELAPSDELTAPVAPPCGARVDGTFDAEALADGRCGKDEVLGVRVLLGGVRP
jgi:hypothetical protein